MNQQFIIFAKEDREVTNKLQVAFAKFVRSDDVCWCGSLDDFIGKFQRPHNYITAVIMLVETRSELEIILAGQDLLEGMRVLLVLPDREDETIALAHKLFPRFITFIDADFTAELTAIIRKMATLSR